ncbi:MAG: hypothetical protein ABEK01_01520 [Candidatus Nanohaloarchaea archaeon]
MNLRLTKRAGKVRRAARASVSSPMRLLSTAFLSALVFAVAVFSTNPGYSIDLLTAGTEFWALAFRTRLSSLIWNSGMLGLGLTSLYSLGAGAALTNLGVQLRSTGSGLKNLASVLPGVTASGCASCGAGLLAFMGLGGVFSNLPLDGNLVRAGGVMLIAFAMSMSGDPEVCEV